MQTSRRNLFKSSTAVLASGALSKSALAQAFPFTPNQRDPDPAVQIFYALYVEAHGAT